MIRDVFLAPPYQIRVGDLGPQHALRVKCMCGAGPWYINTFWLRRRYAPHEFLRWVSGNFVCPDCGTSEVVTWSVVEAYWEHNQEAP
jgi:hypothetical protein